MEDISSFIDHWLQNPTQDGFEHFDADELLRYLDQRISDAWEHNCEAERKSLLELRRALLDYQELLRKQEEDRFASEPVGMTATGFPLFISLSQALNFLVGALESGDCRALLAACTRQRHPAGDKHELKAFRERLFPALQEYQRQQDLRLRYQNCHFPRDMDRFTLGGHMAELGGIHIDFTRLEAGWVLDGIDACR